MNPEHLENLFLELSRTADPAAMLARMGDAKLAALAKHLTQSGISSGWPGIVLGLAETEIIARWVAQNLGNHSPVGEG